MKNLQGKAGAVLAGICLCAFSSVHADGGGMMGKMLDGCNTDSYRWKSMSDAEYLRLEVLEYNKSEFEMHLSRFGMHEWTHFTPEQQKKAMSLADNTDMSPDDAVFQVAKSS